MAESDAEAVRLDVAGLSKRYGATVALAGVDLTVRPGEVHALIGENGAGKSTLLGVLAGTTRADAGRMRLDGHPFAPTSPRQARDRGIALIHQELSLCPHLTVEENVLLGGELARGGWIDRRRSRARALAALAALPHPELIPERRIADLSLPARQIVEICRALAADARVLLMDEPTSSLQGGDVGRLFELIRRLAARGIAIVYVSHFLEELRQIATRFTVLRDGQPAGTGDMTSVSNDELIARMVGRPVAGLFPTRRRTADHAVALSVRHLASPPRLRDASFDLRRGEILGIAGLIGSGRTEMLRTIAGLDTGAQGAIELAGRPHAVSRRHAAPRVRGDMGFLSEDRKGEGLALPLSIADNVMVSRPAVRIRGLLDLARQAERTRHWMRELRVRARSPWQRVQALSGGNQQKVAIARLLNQEAGVWLLDEPTRGIDIGSKAEVYEIIARQAERGGAILIVSSYLPELFGLCDRLAVMHRGRLSEARPIVEWTPESALSVAVGASG